MALWAPMSSFRSFGVAAFLGHETDGRTGICGLAEDRLDDVLSLLV